MRIDSHHHLWTYSADQYTWINDSMSVLKRDFTVSDLQSVCQAAGVTGVVAVQARQSLAETQDLLNVAAAESMVRGVVGWVPLADESIREVLAEVTASAWLKGVRHVVQDEPDDGFILGHAFNQGIRVLSEFDLVYDILIFPKQLANSIRFVDQHPEQPFVLDHIAKPVIQAAKFDAQWAKGFRELGKRSNVVGCKFSGIVTEVRDATWSVELLRPYWDVALEVFGAQRLMFGSDWPVCLLRANYNHWFESVAELASELSMSEQGSFWSANACRVYRLNTEPTTT